MGRLKKYQTEEEKQAVKRQRAKEYYWNNKEQEDEKAKQRYANESPKHQHRTPPTQRFMIGFSLFFCEAITACIILPA